MSANLGRRAVLGGAVASLLVGCRDQRAPEPRMPARIVSQIVDADEILFELGPKVRARVVGLSAMADDPRYSASANRWPPEIPRVAGTSETLLAAHPDLVVVAEFSSAEVRALLASAGIQTLVLSGFDGFEDYRNRVGVLGRAVMATEAADDLVRRFDARLADVRVPPGPVRPGAISWVSGNVAGRGTTFDDLAGALGLENLAARHGRIGHQSTALEQIVAWNPRIVVTDAADESQCPRRADELRTVPGWSATDAARRGGIIPVPSRLLFSAGWAMLDALQWIRDRLPEVGS